MWAEIRKHAGEFSSAVVSGLDEDGYPYSLRCQPELVEAEQILRLTLPEYPHILPGPASLLYHEHDEWLWNLRSFVICGELVRGSQGWIFHPLRFVPGMGIGNPFVATVRFVLQGRRKAKRYLRGRGLARPKIDWDRLIASSSAGSKGKAGGG